MAVTLPRVTLVELPSESRKSILTNPLGLTILKSLLKREYPGINVTLLDGQTLATAAIARQIADTAPDLVGYSVKPFSLPFLKEVAEQFGLTGAGKKVLSIFGHAHPTLAPAGMLERYPEGIMVRGDGEYPMLDLVKYWQGERTLEQVRGISYRGAGGGTVNNPLAPFNLAEAPELDFQLFRQIYEAGGEIWLEASRVCAHRCAFCVEHEAARGVPRREYPESYVEYLLRTAAQYWIAAVHFTDSDFLGNDPDRAGRLVSHVQYLPEVLFDTRSDAVVRAEQKEPGYWTKIASHRVTQVYLGFDAGSAAGPQSQRQLFAKGGSGEIDLQATGILEKAGIDVMGGFIQLHPWSNAKQVRDNIAHIRKIGTHNIFKGLRVMRLQVGSALYNKAAQDGLLLGPSAQEPLFGEYRFADPQIGRIAEQVKRWEDLTANVYQGIEAIGRLRSQKLEGGVPRQYRSGPGTIPKILSRLVVADLAWLEQLLAVPGEEWEAQREGLFNRHLENFIASIDNIWHQHLVHYCAIGVWDEGSYDDRLFAELARLGRVIEEFIDQYQSGPGSRAA